MTSDSCSVFATSVTSSARREKYGASAGISLTILSRSCSPIMLISSFCIVGDVYFARFEASLKWFTRTSSPASARNFNNAKKLPGFFSPAVDSTWPLRAIFCLPQ